MAKIEVVKIRPVERCENLKAFVKLQARATR